MKDKKLITFLVRSTLDEKIDSGKIIKGYDLNLEKKNFHSYHEHFFSHLKPNYCAEFGKDVAVEQNGL
jgi:hypothetical protein